MLIGVDPNAIGENEGELLLLIEAMKADPDGNEPMDMIRLAREKVLHLFKIEREEGKPTVIFIIRVLEQPSGKLDLVITHMAGEFGVKLFSIWTEVEKDFDKLARAWNCSKICAVVANNDLRAGAVRWNWPEHLDVFGREVRDG